MRRVRLQQLAVRTRCTSSPTGKLACRNNGVCAASRDGIMAALGVVSAVSTDTGYDFVRTNLVEQAWQHRRIADGIVRHLNGADF